MQSKGLLHPVEMLNFINALQKLELKFIFVTNLFVNNLTNIKV